MYINEIFNKKKFCVLDMVLLIIISKIMMILYKIRK